MAPKPTLLAFHGSGSNGTIHTVQLARLARLLREHFEIESLTGTISSSAGPGILPFFDGCGPYYRWCPPTEALDVIKQRGHTNTSAQLPADISTLIRTTIERIRAEGGRVVGLIGFSQGTRVVAGLLKAAEMRHALGEAADSELDWLDFDFGLSVCSSFPPPLVPPEIMEALAASNIPDAERTAIEEAKIKTPTLHVLGKQDEWRWAGTVLIEGSYVEAGDGNPGQTAVFEFATGHHYPVQAADTEKVKKWMMGTWERAQKAREGKTEV